MRYTLAVFLTGIVLSGCTVAGSPILAYGPVFELESGERQAFCEHYANQTTENAFANYADPEGPGSLSTYRQAERIGEAAYRRCLQGRTG